jgi:hypothetical protein
VRSPRCKSAWASHPLPVSLHQDKSHELVTLNPQNPGRLPSRAILEASAEANWATMAAVARVFRGCRFLMLPAKKPVAAAAGAQATSRRSTARSRSRCRSPTRSAGSQAQTRSPAPAPSSSSGRTSRPRTSRYCASVTTTPLVSLSYFRDKLVGRSISSACLLL